MIGTARVRALAALAPLALLVACGSSAAAPATTSAATTSATPPSATPSATTSVASKAVRLPPVAGVFDYQLGGSYAPAAGVQVVDRDRTSVPAKGLYSICYVNAFQSQAEEASFWTSKHPDLLLRVNGKLVQDPGWPGEYMLDTSTAAKRTALAGVVGGWIDGCGAKGFAAIEADNLDSFTRKGVGSALTAADNIAFARLLVARAHADGLAIGQKNAVEQSKIGKQSVGFDFAVAEECEVYRECGGYTAQYGSRVFEIEYTDNGTAAYARACKARAGTMSIILRDRDVVPRGDRAYVYKHC